MCPQDKSKFSSKNRYLEVAGFVVDRDNGETLPYTSILDEKTGNGTSADSRGFFRIVVSPPTILRIRRLGYKESRIALTYTSANILYTTFYLEKDTITLGEVIVLPWETYEEFLNEMGRAGGLPEHLRGNKLIIAEAPSPENSYFNLLQYHTWKQQSRGTAPSVTFLRFNLWRKKR